MTDPLAEKYAHVADPGIRAFLIAGERLYPDNAVSFTLAEQRAFYDRYCAHFRKGRPFGLAVQDFEVADIPCRRYIPRHAAGATVLYLHGGGFVVGGLESHDDICAEIAADSETMVVAVQYRLAPEHPFPAALDDAWAVSKHLLAEPLRETDFNGLPPAFLVAAGLDPLHDDCAAYAARLRDAGVAAEVRDEPLLVHAFLRARHMSRPAGESFKANVAAIRRFKA